MIYMAHTTISGIYYFYFSIRPTHINQKLFYLYVIKENVQAEIVFTSNYSLESKFFLINVTDLIVTLAVYGFEQYNVPSDFQPILVPQFLIMEDDDVPKFGVGFRQFDDELLYFLTQSSIKTIQLTNHSLEFSTVIEHFITYVSFSVDVSLQYHS